MAAEVITLPAPELSAVSPSAPNLAHLSLKDAEALLHQGNHELKLARQAVEGATADSITAGQRPNPNVSINSLSLTPQSGLGSGSLWQRTADTSFRIDQLFERGNKLELRKEAAHMNLTAVREDMQDILRSQKITLCGAYYELLLAQERERIATENASLYQKTLEATQLRHKAGDVSPSDVSRIRVDVLRAQNDMRQARADREKSRLALAYLLGIESKIQEIQASDPWPDLIPLPVESPETLLDRRGDVRAAKARVVVAEKNHDLARALRTRDVTVGVQYEHFPPDNNNTVGLGLSFPLFVHSYFEGEIRRADSDWQASKDNLNRVTAQALQEINKTQSDLSASRERSQRFQNELLKAAKKAAEAAEFAYKHGAMGVLDLLDSRRTLYATQLDAANTAADYAKALAAWRIFVEPMPQ